jgi:hypothetical protein
MKCPFCHEIIPTSEEMVLDPAELRIFNAVKAKEARLERERREYESRQRRFIGFDNNERPMYKPRW